MSKFSNIHVSMLVSFIIAVFVHVGESQADVTVRKSKTFTNNTGQKASDFHVKVWQKEDNIEIEEFNVDFRPVGGTTISTEEAERGNQPEPAHSRRQNLGTPRTANADNGQHAVDSEMTGNIPPGSGVRVRVRFELTRWNTIRWHGATWTFDKSLGDGGGRGVVGIPNDAFELSDPFPLGGGNYAHRLTIYNDDNDGTSAPFIVSGLRHGTVLDFDDVDDDTLFEQFSDFGSPLPDFTLAPGEHYSIDVVTVGPQLGGGILAAYTVLDATTRGEVGETLLGHETDETAETGACSTVDDCTETTEETCEAVFEGKYRGDGTTCDEFGPIPTFSQWGLAVTAMLLVIGMAVKFGRRRGGPADA